MFYHTHLSENDLIKLVVSTLMVLKWLMVMIVLQDIRDSATDFVSTANSQNLLPAYC